MYYLGSTDDISLISAQLLRFQELLLSRSAGVWYPFVDYHP